MLNENKKNTYSVPTTLWVLATSCVSSKILASPKSDIFGFILSSRRTLLALRSRCITLIKESRWRYTRPLAMPIIMLKRVVHSSCSLLCESKSWKTRDFLGWDKCKKLYIVHARSENVTLTKDKIIQAFIGHVLVNE